MRKSGQTKTCSSRNTHLMPVSLLRFHNPCSDLYFWYDHFRKIHTYSDNRWTSLLICQYKVSQQLRHISTDCFSLTCSRRDRDVPGKFQTGSDRSSIIRVLSSAHPLSNQSITQRHTAAILQFRNQQPSEIQFCLEV